MPRIALLLLIPILAQCRPADPPPERVSRSAPAPAAPTVSADSEKTQAPIRTDRKSYVLTPGPNGLEATVVSTLRAPADTPLYILNCNGAIGATLQRKVGEEWRYAIVVGMNACMSPPVVVPPGGEHSTRIYLNENAVGLVDEHGEKMLRTGTYRVVWSGVLNSFDANKEGWGTELPFDQRVSAPIHIEVPESAASPSRR